MEKLETIAKKLAEISANYTYVVKTLDVLQLSEGGIKGYKL